MAKRTSRLGGYSAVVAMEGPPVRLSLSALVGTGIRAELKKRLEPKGSCSRIVVTAARRPAGGSASSWTLWCVVGCHGRPRGVICA